MRLRFTSSSAVLRHAQLLYMYGSRDERPSDRNRVNAFAAIYQIEKKNRLILLLIERVSNHILIVVAFYNVSD